MTAYKSYVTYTVNKALVKSQTLFMFYITDKKNDRGRKSKLTLQGDQQKAWQSFSVKCNVLELMIS